MRLAAYFMLAILGCLALNSAARAWDPWLHDPRYVSAVTQSQMLSPDKYVNNLTVITTTNPDLIWKDVTKTEVLMTSFTGWPGYDRSYDGTGARPTLWATASTELYDFHQGAGTTAQDMALRTKQLLGMPANSTNDRVIEYYIKPESLFRPTKNVDITNPHSAWNGTFPPQWNPSAQAYQQAWFNANLSTYDPATGDPYPWTQLGYTYDWGNPNSIVGLTEFLAYQNVPLGQSYEDNPIEILAVVSIQSYLYYDRQGNFDITGSCNTVWGGSLYVPLDTVDGNWLTVHRGATITGGEGITFASLAQGDAAQSVVTNHGTIRGRAINTDGSFRDTSLLFLNEGRFVNHGTVTGDLVGLRGTFVAGTPGWTTPTLVIENKAGAMLEGFDYSVRTGDTVDTITNAGTLRGDVDTGGGNDIVINTGLIDGAIRTGAGDDAISSIGGHITGDIDGGAGTDFLTLAGAGGQDFVFHRDIVNIQSVTIAAGDAVRLNGQVSGDVTVQSGGALGGSGSYAGNVTVQSGGRSTPGQSIGTMHIAGDYTQAPGSTYEAEIAKPNANASNACDKIIVAGTATLTDSTVDVRYSSGPGRVITTDDTYNILSAAGGIVGAPDVTTSAGFLAFSGAEAANTYSITATRTATFESVAQGINQTVVARTLDADLPTADSYYGDMINKWSFRSQSAFASGVGRLGSEPYLAAQASATRLSHYLNQRVAERLSTRRFDAEMGFIAPSGGIRGASFAHTPFSTQKPPFWETPGATVAGHAVPTTPAPAASMATAPPRVIESTVVRQQNAIGSPTSIWFQPFGTFFDEPARSRQIGFRANSVGAQLGIDQYLDDDVLFGYLFDYGYTDMKFLNEHGNGSANTYRGGLYSSRQRGPWYVDSLITYGYLDTTVRRIVDIQPYQTTQGAYGAHEISVYWGTGLQIIDWIQPTFSLEYLYRHQQTVAETGQTGAELYIPNDNTHSLFSRLGLRLAKSFCGEASVYTPEFTCGWARELLDDDALEARFAGGSHPFVLDRVNSMRDTAYLGAGLTVQYESLTSVMIRYEGQFSGSGQFSAVEAGFSKRF